MKRSVSLAWIGLVLVGAWCAPAAHGGGACGAGLELQFYPTGGGFAGERFGGAVVFEGSYLVVGGPGRPDLSHCPQGNPVGRVRVYELLDGPPFVSYMYDLEPDDVGCNDGLGAALDSASIGDDGWVLVGSPGHSVIGKADLFDVGTGALLQTFFSSATFGVRFGQSVALSEGDFPIATVGAPDDFAGGGFPGAVYVFNANTGAQVSTIPGVGPGLGGNADFGESLDASGATGVIGAPGAAGGAGRAFVYDLVTGQQLAQLVPEGGCVGRFGASIAVDGELALVGAPGDCVNGFDSGAAYLYDICDPFKPELIEKFHGSGALPADRFGSSVAIRDGVIVVGATREGAGAAPGKAYVFEYDGVARDVSETGVLGADPAPPSDDDNLFGASCAVFEGRVAVGGPDAVAPNASATGSVALFSLAGQSYWVSPTGGAWQAPANWDPGVPGVCEAALFDDIAGPAPLSSSYLVTLTGDASAGRMGVHTDFVNLNLGGNDLSLLSGAPTPASLVVGIYDGLDTRLNVLSTGGAATIHATSVDVAGFEGSFAQLNVNGFGVGLDVTGDVRLGLGGSGIAKFSNGALLTVSAPDRVLSIAGFGEATLSFEGDAIGDIDLTAFGVGGEVSIGAAPGSDGLLNVVDAEVAIKSDVVRVGGAGSGALWSLDGAEVTVDALSVGLAEEAGSFAWVRSEFNASLVVPSGAITAGAGVVDMHVGQGSTVSAIAIDTETGTLVRGAGTLISSAFPLSNFGRVAPQSPTGGAATLTLLGDFRQTGLPAGGSFAKSGRLDVVIGGDGPGESSLFAVSGEAELGGTLIAAYADGFVPDFEVGDTIDVLSASAIEGGFEAALLPALPDGLFFNIAYAEGAGPGDGGAVVQLVVSALDGDVLIDPEGLGFSGNSTPNGAVLGDFGNGNSGAPDGFLDLAVSLPHPGNPSEGNGMVMILFNAGVTGEGEWAGFEETFLTFVGIDPRGLTTGDFNQDGLLDFGVALAGEGAVLVRTNSNEGMNEGNEVTVPAGETPVALSIGDFDQDDGPDLAVALEGAGAVAINLNVGGVGGGWDGLADPVFFPIAEGALPVDVKAADIDNDNDLDLITANPGLGTLAFFKNAGGIGNGWGGFDPPEQYFLTSGGGTGSDPGSVQPGDLDNDKDIDIVTEDRESGEVSIAENEGDGGYAPPAELPVCDDPAPPAVVDLGEDGEGDPEIVVLSTDPETGDRVVKVFRNDQSNGQTQFTNVQTIPVGDDEMFVVAGDLDGNGKGDVVTVGPAGAGPEDGGGFGGVKVYLGLAPPTCAEDLNRDGVIDSADLNIVLATFGCVNGFHCAGDVNGDNAVTSADLNLVLSVFGRACP